MARGTADDHIWPLVQSKLDVLNRAGLSKDDFTEAVEGRQPSGERQARITDLFRQMADEEPSQPDAADAAAGPASEADGGCAAGDQAGPSRSSDAAPGDCVGAETASDQWMAELGDVDLEEWAEDDSWDIPEAEQRPAKKAREQDSHD